MGLEIWLSCSSCQTILMNILLGWSREFSYKSSIHFLKQVFLIMCRKSYGKYF